MKAIKKKISEFRMLAARADRDLLMGYDDSEKKWLMDFIESELIGGVAPSLNSPESFLDAVRTLDASMLDWSRHYGDVVLGLHSDDLDLQQQAKEALCGMITNCPWLFLRWSAAARQS